ncbi:putative peptide modification system cyclase [Xanthomonas sacchari]
MTDATAPQPEVPQLRTLLLTDLCDSVALVEKLGDANAAELFKLHDSLVLELQQRWRGRLIDRSDGLLLLFERPIDGLGFALDYSRGLHALGASRALDLKVRAGLHVGEVLTWRNSDAAVQVGAKPLEVEGLAKPTAARLMTLARPGQILLSAVAESLTHRAARELGERGERLLWKSHGRWRFKGVPTPLEIYEVGEIGHTPLRAPKPTPKAWRDIPLWRRPAALAAEAALIAAFAVGAWFVTRPQPAIAFAERDWVVVGDLRNLTGDAVLDDSLEQAFRISLEQSRYVNVLSDLKVRDTLSRMRRDPDSTKVDRVIASEVAMRDGARAVILPTIAEIGGRIRLSAEIVDPRTQTTVAVESADGKGLGSVLGSVDQVATSLRQGLGEAMDSISSNSAPLPKVTTSSLDALRAYAVAINFYTRRDFKSALQYFQKAIELDNEFALAYMGIMRVYVSISDNAAAQPYLLKAASLRSHLPPRDALYLDAWEAEFQADNWRVAPAKWKMLAGMYPDFYAGIAESAWYQFNSGNYDASLSEVDGFAVQQNPLRDVAFELKGRSLLAKEDYADAVAAFSTAEDIGGYKKTRYHAAALAASGNFSDARKILDSLSMSGMGGDGMLSIFEKVAVTVDQGSLEDARALATQAASGSSDVPPLPKYPLRVMASTIKYLVEPDAMDLAGLDRLFDEIMREVAEGDVRDRDDLLVNALAVIRLAQRAGHVAASDRMLASLLPLATKTSNPVVHQFVAIAKAEKLRLMKAPDQAVSYLSTKIDGNEPFQMHVALRDALYAAGQYKQALQQDYWIARHRGLAYAEPFGGQAFQSMNIADCTLAHLSSARTWGAMGDAQQARQSLSSFRRDWPIDRLPDYFLRRLESTSPASKQ